MTVNASGPSAHGLRRNAKAPDKGAAHPFGIMEPGMCHNLFDGLIPAFDALPRRFQAQPLGCRPDDHPGPSELDL